MSATLSAADPTVLDILQTLDQIRSDPASLAALADRLEELDAVPVTYPPGEGLDWVIHAYRQQHSGATGSIPKIMKRFTRQFRDGTFQAADLAGVRVLLVGPCTSEQELRGAIIKLQRGFGFRLVITELRLRVAGAPPADYVVVWATRQVLHPVAPHATGPASLDAVCHRLEQEVAGIDQYPKEMRGPKTPNGKRRARFVKVLNAVKGGDVGQITDSLRAMFSSETNIPPSMAEVFSVQDTSAILDLAYSMLEQAKRHVQASFTVTLPGDGEEPAQSIPVGMPSLFAYAALDAETRSVVQQRTTEIKGLMRRAVQDIVNIGLKLIEVKERLGHGNFLPWLDAEFQWEVRQAQRFMAVGQRFGECDNLSHFAPSALLLLAAPSTPDAARDEAMELAAQGEPVTHARAKEIVQRRKPSQSATPAAPRQSGTVANDHSPSPPVLATYTTPKWQTVDMLCDTLARLHSDALAAKNSGDEGAADRLIAEVVALAKRLAEKNAA